jgi:hypothetical protein
VAQHGCHRRLKADQNFQNFQQLQNELADLANKIAVARRFFNTTAAESNAARKASPAVLFAQSMGFSPQSFFNLDEAECRPPPSPRSNSKPQLPMRGLSGATGVTRCMGGATGGIGAT